MATQAAYNKPLNARRAFPNAAVLKIIRRMHLYLGLLIAPALLFFAFTGAVQTLSLHESAGSTYTPPTWLARLGQLHKNQNIVPRKPRPTVPDAGSRSAERAAVSALPGQPAASAAAPPKAPISLSTKQRQHLPEKIFFLLVSLGLFISTITGIFMAYRYERGKLLVSALLLAGIAVPLLLLPF